MHNVLSAFKRWNEHKFRNVALLITLAATLSGIPGYAALSFNGIHGFNIQENGKKAIITLAADMPVHYQIDTINANQVKLTLYQAQLARELIGTDNNLQLQPSRFIKQASWQTHAGTVEILLTGPGLGKHVPSIEGGIAKAAEPSQTTYKNTEKPVVVFPKDIPVKTIAEQNTPQALNLLGAERIEIENRAPEPFEGLSKPITQGPKITSITDAKPTVSASTQKQEAFLHSFPETVETADNSIPEPTSLSFQANTSAIQAITFNEHGQPVRVLPKNTPLGTISIGQTQHSYNTLFQEESMSPADQFMSDALTAYHQNQLPEAEQAIQKALQLEPKNDEFLATLAEIQIRLQQFTQACETYQKASAQKPGQYELRYAQALIHARKRSEAIHVLENALNLNPQNTQAIYMLGTLNEEMGNTKSAIIYLEQAASLSPQSTDILYNLGLAYEFSGNFEQAKSNYQRALALNPNATDITTALQRITH